MKATAAFGALSTRLAAGSSWRHTKSKGRVFVRAAPPSKCPRIAAEQASCFDLRLADRSRALGVGRNIKRIRRAVDFAQKAGLAVVLARDNWHRFGPGVED